MTPTVLSSSDTHLVAVLDEFLHAVFGVTELVSYDLPPIVPPGLTHALAPGVEEVGLSTNSERH